MVDESLQKSYFAVLTAPVLKDPSLSWASMVLCAKIAQLTGEEGFCYATNSGLIRMMTRVDPKSGEVNTPSERTLQNWLSELKDGGHIFTDTGPLPPDKNGVVRTGRRIFICTGSKAPERGAEIFTPANFCTERVQNSAPPFKCINNKNKKDTPIAPIEVLDAIDAYIGDDPEYREAFDGFLKNRVALKKPVLTSRAINTIINRLRKENHRETEIAMLDKATENNWLTVYPLKPDEIPVTAKRTEDDEEGIDGI